MERLGTALASILTGMLGAVTFLIVLAATSLPALSIVEDDNAYVTWGVLIGCVVVALIAARLVNRWVRRLWR